MTAQISKGQKTATDIASLLRARNPLIQVTSREEARVERYLTEAAAAGGYKILFWDVAQGITTLDGKPHNSFKDAQDPTAAFKYVRSEAEKGEKGTRQVWVFRDLSVWLDGQAGAAPRRELRNLAKYLPSVPRKSSQAIVILTTAATVPDDLAGHATVIDFPLPDRSEIEKVLQNAIDSLPEFENGKDGKPDASKPLRANAAPADVRDLAIDAAVGLTEEEAASCYAKSLVQTKKIDPTIVSSEKKRVISRERILEWIEPIAGGLDAVGGLENFKAWINVRKHAYTKEARDYGLPLPKGCVLTGVPGCGKSLASKCLPTSWSVPLLRLDPGALKGKFVGDSEGNVRKATKVIEALGRCIVWIDEIEKGMQGSDGNSADGGVSSDQLSVLLNWFQERKGEAFVIVTSNDLTKLPPELIRKGRFDEVFFVDLPNHEERKSVLLAALRANGRADLEIDFEAIADATENFSGAEIAELVPTALYVAYDDLAREITTEDLLAAANDVQPMAVTDEKRIEAIRSKASTLRPATAQAKAGSAHTGGRKLDLEAA